MKKISIVVPMYNEEEMIVLFFKELYKYIDPLKENYSFEIVCINDGSSDNTLDLLKKEKEENNDIVIVDLSKNSGQEKALRAGLITASGDAVIPMDADLQDPPSVLPELISKWEEGYDIVDAKRKRRDKDGAFRRFCSKTFYRYQNHLSKRGKIPENVCFFRLVSRDALNSILTNEGNWSFRVEVACCGYSTTTVEFDRPSREKGKTKYSFAKLVKTAIDNFIIVSKHPTSWINPVVIPYGIITLVSVILGTTLMSLNAVSIINVSMNGLIAYQIVNIVLVVILLVIDTFVLYTRNEYKKMKKEEVFSKDIIKEVIR